MDAMAYSGHPGVGHMGNIELRIKHVTSQIQRTRKLAADLHRSATLRRVIS